jgi:FlaA1/EpsC-like NDP-sugar epimerase
MALQRRRLIASQWRAPVQRLLVDIVVYAGAIVLANLMRFDFRLNVQLLYLFRFTGVIELLIFITFQVLLRVPFTAWHFASLREVEGVGVLVTLTKLVTLPFLMAGSRVVLFSRGMYLISALLAFLLMVGARAVIRIWYEYQHGKATMTSGNDDRKVPLVIVVGAGNAGEKLLREYESHPGLGRVVGLLDDDPVKLGATIRGKRVLGTVAQVPEIVRRTKADELIVALPSHQASVTRALMNLTAELPVVVKTLPSLWQIAEGTVLVEQMHKVQLEDLLQRDAIRTDLASVAEYVRDKVVLVTGAGGSIGSEIVRQVVRFEPRRLVLLGRGENRIFAIDRELREKVGFTRAVPIIGDMRDQERMQWLFDTWQPDIVFHAAAHKHVPLMEQNPEEAILNNVAGTRILLDQAVGHHVARFINISTDKAVNPVNFMGASKRIIELMVQEYMRRFDDMQCASVRFGNVLGSEGSVVGAFERQLQETRTLRVTDPNMERFFMLIPEAVQLVLQAGALASGGDIFVLRMGEPIKIAELARTYIKLSGLEVGADASVVVTGNRGNEKLTEELWSASERMEPTDNPGIMRIVCATCPEPEKLTERLDALCDAARTHDIEGIRRILHEIDPSINIPGTKSDKDKDKERDTSHMESAAQSNLGGTLP